MQHCKAALLFFLGIFQISMVVSVLFLGWVRLMQYLELVKSWLSASDLVSGQSGCGWKTWPIQLAHWRIKVNVLSAPKRRETWAVAGLQNEKHFVLQSCQGETSSCGSVEEVYRGRLQRWGQSVDSLSADCQENLHRQTRRSFWKSVTEWVLKGCRESWVPGDTCSEWEGQRTSGRSNKQTCGFRLSEVHHKLIIR